MQLKISIRDKDRVVHCPQWQDGPYGSEIPVGDIAISNCAKCGYYKGLKDIFTLECVWREVRYRSSAPLLPCCSPAHPPLHRPKGGN